MKNAFGIFLLLIAVDLQSSESQPQHLMCLSEFIGKDTIEAEAAQKFFACFPRNFAEFDEMYGFKDHERNLYRHAHSQILDLLPIVGRVVGRSRLVARLLDIAKHATYDADAPAYLQQELINELQASDTLDVFDTLPADDMLRAIWFLSETTEGPKFTTSWCAKTSHLVCRMNKTLITIEARIEQR